MPDEVQDKDRDLIEQKRFEIERQRFRFRAAMLIIFLLLLMYFVVAPLSAAYGKPLDLPSINLVIIFLALVSFPAFGVHLGAANVAGKLMERINITVKPPVEGEGNGGS